MEERLNIKIIEEYILANKLSKTNFCKMCKISLRTLKKIFTGKDFNLRVLFKIASATDIEIGKLFY